MYSALPKSVFTTTSLAENINVILWAIEELEKLLECPKPPLQPLDKKDCPKSHSEWCAAIRSAGSSEKRDQIVQMKKEIENEMKK